MSEHDAARRGLSERLDSIERRIDELRGELDDVRSLVRAPVAETVAAPSVASAPPASPRTPPFVAAPLPHHRPPVRPATSTPAVSTSTSSLPAPPAPRRERPGASELLERYELLGPRGLAIVGGAVTALGIGLLFVLAANRGWIGPAERVLIGAVASALVFGGGLVVRARYGQLLAALAAVGAGAAGAYATLAAAAARYDLVPDALALPLAGLIAALTTAVALAWGSQILAGIGLIGSALAPALQAIDTGITPGSAAFAVIVLAATAVVAARRDWEPLLATVAAIVGAQTLVLVADEEWVGDTAAVAVGLALAAVMVGAGILLRLGRGESDLRPLAAALPLAGTGVALVTGAVLLEVGTDRGLVLLAAGAAWAGAWLALQARDRPLALVIGASSLALLAVATAELVSDDALALAWSSQAILLSALAGRLRDARLQAGGLVYLALAAGHVLAVDAPPATLFDPSRVDAVASVVLAAVALAALVAGVTAPATHTVATETGVLAFITWIRTSLERYRVGLQKMLLLAAGTMGVLACATLLIGIDFEAGHVAASGVAAAGAAALAIAARRRSTGLAVAALVALVLVLGESLFDADQLAGDDDRSAGGLSMLFAAAGLLAGGFALRVLHPTRRRLGIVTGIAASVALAWAAGALPLLVPRADDASPSEGWLGIGLLAVALVYAALAAAVLGPGRLRNLSTTLWTLALVALLSAEGFLLQDGRWFAAVVAVTGALVAAAALPLRELRLLLAGAVVTGLATIGTLAFVTSPDHFLEASASPADGLWVLVACVAAATVVAGTCFATDRPEARWAGIVYDLSELSSVARAASFIAVGAAILAGGAVLQKLSARLEARDGSAGSAS